jgi:hypothetical protein
LRLAFVSSWTTPIIQDPFAVSLDDQLSVLLAAHETIIGKPGFVQASSRIDWSRQEKTFASSEGSYLTQTLYTAFSGAQAAVTANGSGVLSNVAATGSGRICGSPRFRPTKGTLAQPSPRSLKPRLTLARMLRLATN